MIEVRNGSDRVLKEHVSGLGHLDELVQTGLNQDPSDTNETNGGGCERFFWAMRDANFNPPPPRLRRAGVLGLATHTGFLVERYAYTPYGLSWGGESVPVTGG